MASKVKESFTHYDTADYLTNESEIAAYMDAVMEDGPNDPALIAHALGVIARARSMSQLSQETGLSREGLYKALSGEGNPSFATIIKVATALGLQLSFKPAS